MLKDSEYRRLIADVIRELEERQVVSREWKAESRHLELPRRAVHRGQDNRGRGVRKHLTTGGCEMKVLGCAYCGYYIPYEDAVWTYGDCTYCTKTCLELAQGDVEADLIKPWDDGYEDLPWRKVED